MVETPVLFITFCRPDYARQTWNGIKAAKPKKLYFYSNKGREEKEGEVERNNEIRSYINEIDWDCDLHTFFRDECVNVYDSLRGAINWLFENESEGIILEEDCVPTLAFFSYIDQLIVKFRGNEKIWCISGDNWFNYQSHNYDYHFSHYHFMYGWATWREKWQRVDWQNLGAKEAVRNHIFRPLFKNREQSRYREKEVMRVKDFVEKTKCWDYYWGIIMDQNEALTVHPKCNLIHNIGVSGTHHENGTRESIVNAPATIQDQTYTIVNEPSCLEADKDFDLVVYKALFKPAPLPVRAVNKAIRILKSCLKH